tara:strand:+ start:205 stop:924 length:720 start_codon:yes stop_codon:yes gene_type:complete
MSEDGNEVVPGPSRNSGIGSSRKKTILTVEEENEIMKLEWCHHIQVGDLLTKGAWNKTHQDKIASCIPPDLQGKTVLDIGFNDGYFSFLSEERGAKKVTGVEINYRETAKLAHKLKQSKVEFYEKSMLDFRTDEGFDVVLYLGVYYHVVNIIDAFEKVYSLTAPGGEAYIEGSLLFGKLNRVMKLPSLVRLAKIPKEPPNPNFWIPTLTALKKMIRFAGFEDVEVLSFVGSRVVVRGRK